MTSPGSLEDALRRAFQEIASEVPADSVPPLARPARRRRLVSRRPVTRAACLRRTRSRCPAGWLTHWAGRPGRRRRRGTRAIP